MNLNKKKTLVFFLKMIIWSLLLLPAIYAFSKQVFLSRSGSYNVVVMDGYADIFYYKGVRRLAVVSRDGNRTFVYCERTGKGNACLQRSGIGVEFVSGDTISVIALVSVDEKSTNNIIVGLRANERNIMNVNLRIKELGISCNNINNSDSVSGWSDLGDLDQCLRP